MESGGNSGANHAKPPTSSSSKVRQGRDMMRAAAMNRARTFSNTSTRGAFMPSEPVPASASPTKSRSHDHHHHPHHHTSNRAPEAVVIMGQSPVIERQPSLGEMASMAMASLDMPSIIPSGSPMPPPTDFETPRTRGGVHANFPNNFSYEQHQFFMRQSLAGNAVPATADSIRYSDRRNGQGSRKISSASRSASSELFGSELVSSGIPSTGSTYFMQSPQQQSPSYGAVSSSMVPPLPPPQQLQSQQSYPMQKPYYQQEQDIINFSNMVQQSSRLPPPPLPITSPRYHAPPLSEKVHSADSLEREASDSIVSSFAQLHGDDYSAFFENEDHRLENALDHSDGLRHLLLQWADWCEKNTLIRHYFYDYKAPEFTSLQQFCWCIIIGLVMGLLTALWKKAIDFSCDVMWVTVPTFLKRNGFFTELDGLFPLYNYMWICPSVFGGVLSYIMCILPVPIPGQNEWIQNVHTKGVQDHRTFWNIILISTAGMASGLSLGPELPLVLSAGMAGSWLGIVTKQSMLQARAMNLTAASAAVGGFFGFPMAGALFVLEIPHRMGLQYFEALSPGTMASIVAVLCNRLILQDDVTGYFQYPFLTETLPSKIFFIAIIFGFYGSFVGSAYAKGVMYLKNVVHDWFHVHEEEEGHEEEDDDDDDSNEQNDDEPHHVGAPHDSSHLTFDEELHLGEDVSLLGMSNRKKGGGSRVIHEEPVLPCYQRAGKCLHKYFCCVIPYEPYRAGAAGMVAGAICGVVGIFLPHVMFWGETQLQTLIDQGETPLPYFNAVDNPECTDLYALGFCMQNDFGLGCTFSIGVAKILVTGLSVGTGIVGGHFWGPLFTGCAASHFLTALAQKLQVLTGFSIFRVLTDYSCVSILCTMGATHVVTFRAHTAIMLILTLTISSFEVTGDDDRLSSFDTAGDYSAVFPLLVISVFLSLYHTRDLVFYKQQRSRGDIMAVPEALCEPGKEGKPMILHYEGSVDGSTDETMDGDNGGGGNDDNGGEGGHEGTSGEDDFMDLVGKSSEDTFTEPETKLSTSPKQDQTTATDIDAEFEREQRNFRDERRESFLSPLPPRPQSETVSARKASPDSSQGSNGDEGRALDGLDALLAKPLDDRGSKGNRHRRIQSAPDSDVGSMAKRRSSQKIVLARERTSSFLRAQEDDKTGSNPAASRHVRKFSNGSVSSFSSHKVVASFGEIADHQPSLMDQARMRAASTVRAEAKVRRESTTIGGSRHARHNSNASANSTSSIGNAADVALSTGDMERTFNSMLNMKAITATSNKIQGKSSGSRPPAPPYDSRK